MIDAYSAGGATEASEQCKQRGDEHAGAAECRSGLHQLVNALGG